MREFDFILSTVEQPLYITLVSDAAGNKEDRVKNRDICRVSENKSSGCCHSHAYHIGQRHQSGYDENHGRQCGTAAYQTGGERKSYPEAGGDPFSSIVFQYK